MTFIYIIVFIIAGIAIYDDQKKRKKLVNTKKIIGYDTRTGVPLYEGEKVTGYDTQTGRAIISGREVPKKEVKPKQPIDKTKISNSILMIIGAALVVFATVVFLTSSWDSIPNIIKPFILIFIQLVFYGSYKICTTKLDIPKTGKVFQYLSLAFFPIVLVSFSCFELIGDSLSINGEYASLYFMACFIITDIAYKIYAKYYPDLIVKIASYVMELLAVICLGFYIDLEYITTLLLCIYTTIVFVLLHYNYIDNKAYGIVNIITIALTMFFCKALASQAEENLFFYYLPYIIYSILFFIMYFLKKDSEDQKYCLVFFIINYILTITYIGTLDIPRNFFYLLCLIPLIVFAKLSKNNTVKSIFQWLIFCFTTLIVISNIINLDNSYFDTLTFLIATIIYLTELIIFKEDKPVFKCATYLSFSLLLMNTCHLLEFDELTKYVLIVVALIVYLIEKAFPSINDSSTKHIVPLLLSLESAILACYSFGDNSNYSIIIPLVLMIIYTKYEKANETYTIFPALFSLTLFTKGNELVDICLCSALVLIYSLLSALKRKENLYTFISLLTIVIGLPVIGTSAYIVFITLCIWSLIHYLMYENHKELFILTGIVSIFGIYIKALIDLEVTYISMYFLGALLSLIATSKLVFNKDSKELPFFEAIAFLILTIASLFTIMEPVDAVIMIIIFFILTLFTFVNKYKTLFYCSLAGMIIHIIKQTLEFWSSIPIYIYVLFIGLTLIAFAMNDERINKKKKDKENTNKKDNIE